MPELHLTSIDLAQPEDEPTLWLMLTFAASMSEGAESAIRSAKRDAYLRSYVEGWGRDPDDLGLVARDGSGAPVGAAWVRRKPSGSPFHFGDESEPELSIGVCRIVEARASGADCSERFSSSARAAFFPSSSRFATRIPRSPCMREKNFLKSSESEIAWVGFRL